MSGGFESNENKVKGTAGLSDKAAMAMAEAFHPDMSDYGPAARLVHSADGNLVGFQNPEEPAAIAVTTSFVAAPSANPVAAAHLSTREEGPAA
jgi:hypothetical protein